MATLPKITLTTLALIYSASLCASDIDLQVEDYVNYQLVGVSKAIKSYSHDLDETKLSVSNNSNTIKENTKNVKELVSSIGAAIDEIKKLSIELETLKQKMEMTHIVNNNQSMIRPMDINTKRLQYIKTDKANVRVAPFADAEIKERLDKGVPVQLEYCNEFSWCKFLNEQKYIARQLLSIRNPNDK